MGGREKEKWVFGYLKRKIQREAVGTFLFGAYEVVYSCSQCKSLILISVPRLAP